jgi:hypothetical protein
MFIQGINSVVTRTYFNTLKETNWFPSNFVYTLVVKVIKVPSTSSKTVELVSINFKISAQYLSDH